MSPLLNFIGLHRSKCVSVDGWQVTLTEAADSCVSAHQFGTIGAAFPPAITDGSSVDIRFDPWYRQRRDEPDNGQQGAQQKPADEPAALRLSNPTRRYRQQEPTDKPQEFHARKSMPGRHSKCGAGCVEIRLRRP